MWGLHPHQAPEDDTSPQHCLASNCVVNCRNHHCLFWYINAAFCCNSCWWYIHVRLLWKTNQRFWVFRKLARVCCALSFSLHLNLLQHTCSCKCRLLSCLQVAHQRTFVCIYDISCTISTEDMYRTKTRDAPKTSQYDCNPTVDDYRFMATEDARFTKTSNKLTLSRNPFITNWCT